VVYNYDAVNLIKINNDKNYTNNNLFLGHTYNYFVWKLVNQNFIKGSKEKIDIEIIFNLGVEFEKFDLDFNLNFTKSVEKYVDSFNKNQSIVTYRWGGYIKSEEVLVVESKFPLYFEQCGTVNLNYFMVVVGAFFIIFLIAILLVLFSVCFEETQFF